jgi:hypothetical protein
MHICSSSILLGEVYFRGLCYSTHLTSSTLLMHHPIHCLVYPHITSPAEILHVPKKCTQKNNSIQINNSDYFTIFSLLTHSNPTQDHVYGPLRYPRVISETQTTPCKQAEAHACQPGTTPSMLATTRAFHIWTTSFV